MSTDRNAKGVAKSSSKKMTAISNIQPVVIPVDPTECPFREFRDNELQQEFWGMGPSAFRVYSSLGKGAGVPKQPPDYVWADDQTQPLPRSVRQYLYGYERAVELAMTRWNAEVVIFEENNNNSRMSVADVQLSHAQVLNRSSFCRQVLSACFILERTANFIVEHQWEHFSCTFGPEGWRAKYHIYSPGIKPGGGSQHRPTLSKNGCYLVRLYYLGAWRCVWVTDQVPIDATDSPLLPFSPLLGRNAPVKSATKQVPAPATSNVVLLWPLLICKALLKLAAPNMNSDENSESMDDELMPEFDILHALTGAMDMSYHFTDIESLWSLITKEVTIFAWDDDDETQASTVRSKSTKKSTTKDVTAVKRSLLYINITETKDYPPYFLPGITPSFEMSLLVTMARDVPLKKPLPEPELPLWKTYRWIHWARVHGLYDAYDCPRTRFLRVNGLLKLSFAPHLLDVVSTESLTVGFLKTERSGKEPLPKEKKGKDPKVGANTSGVAQAQQQEELRDWMLFNAVHKVTKSTYVLYYPSMYECASAASNPIIRVTKAAASKILDVHAPKSAPLYLQIDGPEVNELKISLNVLHPRILSNAGVFIIDHIESAYLVVERFEWFEDCELPKPKAFIRTCGYDTVETSFVPGRHFCRIWVHSRMNWHIFLISESTLQLGPRDQVQVAAVRECPWASKFLLNLGSAFSNWLKATRSTYTLRTLQTIDMEFFKSYLPDLPWDNKVVGYNRYLLHWMFRQALQNHIIKKVMPADLPVVLPILRQYFRDPDFGFPPKPVPNLSLKDIADTDPCDCILPEYEEVEVEFQDKEDIEEQVLVGQETEKVLVSPEVMDKLLKPPVSPVVSNVCDLATEEVPCEILKKERDKVIRRHIAATTIQAFWRGTWARMCLSVLAVVGADAFKILQDTVFGNQENLSSLMKEFFLLYPRTKYSYSVASALSGIYGLRQHNGTSQVTAKCKWIPYFQGVFYCHVPCKVHFDVSGSLHHSTVEVYDNDTEEKLPQAYNAHKTFDFNPNTYGYTVLGHGSVNEVQGIFFDASWQLTVFSSLDGAFHICTNDDDCREIPLYSATKLHIDEIFIPNRRNILGGIQLSVTRHEAVSFRAAATSPDLEMVAKLRTVAADGSVEELASCAGKGEVYWPYIRLEPAPPREVSTFAGATSYLMSTRSLSKQKSKPGTLKHSKSASKLKLPTSTPEPKKYILEVVAPNGWPLTIDQWKRVDEVRNSPEFLKVDNIPKKVVIKEKATTSKLTKDKPDKMMPSILVYQPQPDDAYVELECSLSIMGGILARRDDERELEFLDTRMSWEEMEPGRNKRGAQIRQEFREEYLELPPTPYGSHISTTDDLTNYEVEGFQEHFEDELKKAESVKVVQGPSPTTESGLIEMSIEVEEEIKYMLMPEQLRDKFVPLSFVPMCTKELSEDGSVALTADMAEAAKQARHARIEAAIERMNELQYYNEVHVLGRQRERQMVLEKLYVDATLPSGLEQVFYERKEAIAQETALRSVSATKKKQETKGKK